MRIAVVHNLPPGGQKRALYEQLKILGKKHWLDLFLLSEESETFLSLLPLVKNCFTASYFYPQNFFSRLFSLYRDLPRAYQFLAEKINKGGYDVAYVNPCFLTQAPFILRFLKIPSLYYCPEPKREFYEKIPRVKNWWSYHLTLPFRWPLKEIEKINIKAATRVLTNSFYSQKKIKEIYQITSFVNYLGVNTKIFRIYQENFFGKGENFGRQNFFSRGRKQIFVLSVGTFSLLKGFDFLIKSLAKVPFPQRPKLILVGYGGEEREFLSKLANSLEVRIEIRENVSDLQLVKLYNQARVFLYAPLQEPFGMALLEALSCGLPVVAVEEGGIPEIISSKKLGLLVERNEEKFAEALRKILQSPVDFQEREARRQYIEKNWNWEKSVKGLEKHLKEIAQ